MDEAKHTGNDEYFELRGHTALLAAARAGHVDVVRFPLSMGACKHACKPYFRKVVE